jgi:hypothetical protein
VGRGSWDRLATEGPGLQRRLWKAPGWEGAGGIKVFNSRGRGGARSTPARRLSPGLQPRWALSSQFSLCGPTDGVCGRTPVPSLRDPVIFPRTHAGAFLFRPFGAGSCGARPGGSHEKVVLPHTPCAPPFTLLVPRGGRNQESKRWGRGGRGSAADRGGGVTRAAVGGPEWDGRGRDQSVQPEGGRCEEHPRPSGAWTGYL